MSKRKSLVRQFIERLESMACYGQSRKEAKEKLLSENEVNGVEGWQPIRVDGIYSYETMRSYKKECVGFANWVRGSFNVRDIEPAKAHVSSYLQHRLDSGDSAWTLKLVRSALAKVYQDPSVASNVNLPLRRKNEITRSRGEKAMDAKFSPTKNRDLVDFCKATGVRRHELQQVKVKDIGRDESGKLKLKVHQGKGGRSRSVPILGSLEGRVLEIIQNKDADSRIIEKIPVRADIHGYRRDYAVSYYKELAGNDFDPRNKDTSAILQVSWALGHNRLDVVTRNYLG